MKTLSKYALKQLTDDEFNQYVAEREAEAMNTRYVTGGCITVEHEDYGWHIQAIDHDNWRVEESWTDDFDAIETIISDLVQDLAEASDSDDDE